MMSKLEEGRRVILAHACPYCMVYPGEQCESSLGRILVYPHKARYNNIPVHDETIRQQHRSMHDLLVEVVKHTVPNDDKEFVMMPGSWVKRVHEVMEKVE